MMHFVEMTESKLRHVHPHQSRGTMKLACFVIAILLAVPMAFPIVGTAIAADQKLLGTSEEIGDVDITRPVFFNVREEYYKLPGDAWRNALIFRTDVIKVADNLILRFDVPLMGTNVGKGTDYGLGDIYGQALYFPYRSDRGFFGIGSGLTAPSSTENTLGTGKWQVSPLVAPGWWFKDPRALFFVKVQDYISFAGQSDRADIHNMTVTPTYLVRLSSKWWIGADTEGKVNWEDSDRWSFKSGVFIMRLWTRTYGTWIKPEIPWGPNREGDFNIKASFFVNY